MPIDCRQTRTQRHTYTHEDTDTHIYTYTQSVRQCRLYFYRQVNTAQPCLRVASMCMDSSNLHKQCSLSLRRKGPAPETSVSNNSSSSSFPHEVNELRDTTLKRNTLEGISVSKREAIRSSSGLLVLDDLNSFPPPRHMIERTFRDSRKLCVAINIHWRYATPMHRLCSPMYTHFSNQL